MPSVDLVLWGSCQPCASGLAQAWEALHCCCCSWPIQMLNFAIMCVCAQVVTISERLTIWQWTSLLLTD